MCKFDHQTIALRSSLEKWIQNPTLNHDLALEASGYGFVYDTNMAYGLSPSGNWKPVYKAVVIMDVQLLWEHPKSAKQIHVSLKSLLAGGHWVEIWREDEVGYSKSAVAFERWTKRAIRVEPMKQLEGCKALLVRPDGHLGYIQRLITPIVD
jgi:hypothetical protein